MHAAEKKKGELIGIQKFHLCKQLQAMSVDISTSVISESGLILQTHAIIMLPYTPRSMRKMLV